MSDNTRARISDAPTTRVYPLADILRPRRNRSRRPQRWLPWLALAIVAAGILVLILA
jgi:hypothetical protein